VFTEEVTRVTRMGTDGKLGGQAQAPAWPARGDLTDSVNFHGEHLTGQVRQHRGSG